MARLVIMDEPTSVLTPQAVRKLFETLRLLSGEGCSILYISHKLEELLQVGDFITVLRDGNRVSIALRMHDAEKDQQVWSARFEDELENMGLAIRALRAEGMEPVVTQWLWVHILFNDLLDIHFRGHDIFFILDFHVHLQLEIN